MEAADGEVSRFKQREVDYRIIVRQLPDNQEADGRHGDHRQHNDFVEANQSSSFAAVER